MPFVVLKSEKNFADVVTRAFGKLKAADATRARAAVLRANPHIDERATLEPGAVVVIPGIPGIPGLSAPTPEKAETPAGEAVAQISVGLEDYRKKLGASARDEQAAASDLATLLKSKEIKALVKQLPDAAEYVERAAVAARARVEEHKARAAFLKTLTMAQNDLDELAKKLG